MGTTSLTKDGAGSPAWTAPTPMRAARAHPNTLEEESTVNLVRRGARSASGPCSAEIAALVEYPADTLEAITKMPMCNGWAEVRAWIASHRLATITLKARLTLR